MSEDQIIAEVAHLVHKGQQALKLWPDWDLRITMQLWTTLSAVMAGFVLTVIVLLLRESYAKEKSFSIVFTILLSTFFLFIVATDLASMATGDKTELRGLFLATIANLLIMIGLTLLFFGLYWVANVCGLHEWVVSFAKHLFILMTVYASIQVFFLSADFAEMFENARLAKIGFPYTYHYWMDMNLFYWASSLLMPLLAVIPWTHSVMVALRKRLGWRLRLPIPLGWHRRDWLRRTVPRFPAFLYLFPILALFSSVIFMHGAYWIDYAPSAIGGSNISQWERWHPELITVIPMVVYGALSLMLVLHLPFRNRRTPDKGDTPLHAA